MNEERCFERIEDPDGHQVCQIDIASQMIEIQRNDYMTTIYFEPDGCCHVQHRKRLKRKPRN